MEHDPTSAVPTVEVDFDHIIKSAPGRPPSAPSPVVKTAQKYGAFREKMQAMLAELDLTDIEVVVGTLMAEVANQPVKPGARRCYLDGACDALRAAAKQA